MRHPPLRVYTNHFLIYIFLLAYVQTEFPGPKDKDKRNEVWREILATERSYIQGLTDLEEVRRLISTSLRLLIWCELKYPIFIELCQSYETANGHRWWNRFQERLQLFICQCLKYKELQHFVDGEVRRTGQAVACSIQCGCNFPWACKLFYYRRWLFWLKLRNFFPNP